MKLFSGETVIGHLYLTMNESGFWVFNHTKQGDFIHLRNCELLEFFTPNECKIGCDACRVTRVPHWSYNVERLKLEKSLRNYTQNECSSPDSVLKRPRTIFSNIPDEIIKEGSQNFVKMEVKDEE